jgi:hypothetical protein
MIYLPIGGYLILVGHYLRCKNQYYSYYNTSYYGYKVTLEEGFDPNNNLFKEKYKVIHKPKKKAKTYEDSGLEESEEANQLKWEMYEKMYDFRTGKNKVALTTDDIYEEKQEPYESYLNQITILQKIKD